MKTNKFLIRSKSFFQQTTTILAVVSMFLSMSCSGPEEKKPNILFAISDDQSWPHAGAYGDKVMNTMAFDRVARKGVLFNNAFCVAPQCSPNRASILTGRYIWQNEEAGTHASNFPKKLKVFPDILEENGYFIGYTGKGWAPGVWKDSGRKRNPAGSEYNEIDLDVMNERTGKMRPDYAANFKSFLSKNTDQKPFFFWYGAHEPHRPYKKGSGVAAGKKLEDVVVPEFLPDNDQIRSDFLDYAQKEQLFEEHLEKMINLLEEKGQLENTLIVVTSDNGMPFPGAKANLYEYGIHMPMAACWGSKIKAGRVVDNLISHADLMPTFLEAAGIKIPGEVSGISFLNVLLMEKNGRVDDTKKAIFAGRERHTHARPDNLGYPSRAIRTQKYLYIWNVKPDRWPVGNPEGSGQPEGFHDIDRSPSKTYLIEHKDDPEVKMFYEKAMLKRPEEELFDIKNDPACMNNLAGEDKYSKIVSKLRQQLKQILIKQKDPRVMGNGDIFESYPRYSKMRDFDGFKEQGAYNPEYR